MREEGRSYREIAKFFNVTVSATFKIIKAFEKEGRVARLTNPGRPKITDDRIDRRILNISSADPLLSAPKIHAKLQNNDRNPSSVQTIRRRLHGRKTWSNSKGSAVCE